MGSLFLVMLVLHSAPAEAATQRVHTFRDQEFEFALEVEQKPSADGASPFCEPRSVTVRRKQDGRELQKLALEGILLECGVAPGELLIVEDLDFDGRKDLRVLRLLDARLQSTFDYWVYDKKSGRFEKDTRFEALSSPRFDARTRTITSVSRVGAMDKTVEKFRLLKNGKLELIFREETTQDALDGSLLVTTGRKVGGKWVETTRQVEE
ncbi:hypothetical protein ATI61_10339 [Archangium gephyra]|uniref:Lipoprotein n=1 Tax=Archangium gephyra TaxID=48 RepID=A0AAC8TCX4_9BACT|nr:hypothetical protein [Archangium gephyra]AKJ01335.1 Hypothetical protein AA314_02961 [Archangium gephyra]REG34158.1 hypothetical protein ATI61_10339 [Archangium gephyra]